MGFKSTKLSILPSLQEFFIKLKANLIRSKEAKCSIVCHRRALIARSSTICQLRSKRRKGSTTAKVWWLWWVDVYLSYSWDASSFGATSQSMWWATSMRKIQALHTISSLQWTLSSSFLYGLGTSWEGSCSRRSDGMSNWSSFLVAPVHVLVSTWLVLLEICQHSWPIIA